MTIPETRPGCNSSFASYSSRSPGKLDVIELALRLHVAWGHPGAKRMYDINIQTGGQLSPQGWARSCSPNNNCCEVQSIDYRIIYVQQLILTDGSV